MKMLKLTRSHEFLGSKEVWVNLDLIECVFPISDPSYAGVNARLCGPGDNGSYDVVETCEQIAQMANKFDR